MARKVRIQSPGAMYRMMNRGDRREATFEADQDRQRLLHTLSVAHKGKPRTVELTCAQSRSVT
jgi:hypothetical protein